MPKQFLNFFLGKNKMPNRKACATQNKDFCNCICLKPENPNSSSMKKKNKKCPPKHSKPKSKTPKNQKTKPTRRKQHGLISSLLSAFLFSLLEERSRSLTSLIQLTGSFKALGALSFHISWVALNHKISRWSFTAASLPRAILLSASESRQACSLAAVLAARLSLSGVSRACLEGTSEHLSYVPALDCSCSIDHKGNRWGRGTAWLRGTCIICCPFLVSVFSPDSHSWMTAALSEIWFYAKLWK